MRVESEYCPLNAVYVAETVKELRVKPSAAKIDELANQLAMVENGDKVFDGVADLCASECLVDWNILPPC